MFSSHIGGTTADVNIANKFVDNYIYSVGIRPSLGAIKLIDVDPVKDHTSRTWILRCSYRAAVELSATRCIVHLIGSGIRTLRPALAVAYEPATISRILHHTTLRR